MRVLLVSDWVAELGGVERYLGWLRGALADAGDDVRLLTSSAGTRAGGTADYVAYGTSSPALQSFLQVANPSAYARTRRAVREFRPDVVHVCMFEMHLSPAVFRALAGTPTVAMVSNYKPVCPTGLKLLPGGAVCRHRPGAVCVEEGCIGRLHRLRDRPRYALIDHALRNAGAIVTPSDGLARVLTAHGLAARAVRLGVPAPPPGYRRTRAEWATILFAGRLSREKGVDVLLHALALTPGVTLRIAGDGPERPALEALARTLDVGPRTAFLGHVDDARLDEEYAAAWALVAPSLWEEPLGLVALEALVRGVPVVATASGGFLETVRPKADGRLVPAGDVDQLAAALRAVADGSVADPDARSAEERFALADHVSRLRATYAGVVGAR